MGVIRRKIAGRPEVSMDFKTAMANNRMAKTSQSVLKRVIRRAAP
jgi:hypothetical protein